MRYDDNDHCPMCASPQPHLHPAVQHGGEVQLCGDDYHRRVTSQNTPTMIAESDRVLALTGDVRAKVKVRARNLSTRRDKATEENCFDAHGEVRERPSRTSEDIAKDKASCANCPEERWGVWVFPITTDADWVAGWEVDRNGRWSGSREEAEQRAGAASRAGMKCRRPWSAKARPFEKEETSC